VNLMDDASPFGAELRKGMGDGQEPTAETCKKIYDILWLIEANLAGVAEEEGPPELRAKTWQRIHRVHDILAGMETLAERISACVHVIEMGLTGPVTIDIVLWGLRQADPVFAAADRAKLRRRLAGEIKTLTPKPGDKPRKGGKGPASALAALAVEFGAFGYGGKDVAEVANLIGAHVRKLRTRGSE
jgi:hypothetical protein